MTSPSVAHDELAQRKLKELKRDGWPWIWFAYTGFLFLAPFFQPSVKLWLGTLAVFFLFLLVFRTYVRCRDGDRLRLWMIAATVVLGLSAFPWNDGASSLFVFATSFVAFSVSNIRRALFWFGVIGALVLAEGALFRHASSAFRISWTQVFIALFLMVIVGGSNILFAEHHRGEQKLKAAQEENVALAAVAERERIARDLHDVLGHTLSVITMKAELAGRLLDAGSESSVARARSEIADVEAIGRTALAEVREAIGGYRSKGLQAEIEAARRTLEAAGVTLDSDAVAAKTAGLSASEETVLALALREAVTNIVRHARATACSLRFVTEDGRRRLIVEDNGAHLGSREGNGLRGMRERVEALGGRLELARESGTRLQIELPLASQVAHL